MRIAAIALVALLPCVAAADSFVLKDGKTYEGTIHKELKSGYLIKLGDGTIKVIRFDELEDMNSPPTANAPRAMLLPAEPQAVSAEYMRQILGMKNQWAQLREEKAGIGIGFPVAMAVVGSVLLTVGVVQYNSVYANVYAAALSNLVVGGVLAVVGGTTMTVAFVRRASYSRDIEEVERRMSALPVR